MNKKQKKVVKKICKRYDIDYAEFKVQLAIAKSMANSIKLTDDKDIPFLSIVEFALIEAFSATARHSLLVSGEFEKPNMAGINNVCEPYSPVKK